VTTLEQPDRSAQRQRILQGVLVAPWGVGALVFLLSLGDAVRSSAVGAWQLYRPASTALMSLLIAGIAVAIGYVMGLLVVLPLCQLSFFRRSVWRLMALGAVLGAALPLGMKAYNLIWRPGVQTQSSHTVAKIAVFAACGVCAAVAAWFGGIRHAKPAADR